MLDQKGSTFGTKVYRTVVHIRTCLKGHQMATTGMEHDKQHMWAIYNLSGLPGSQQNRTAKCQYNGDT
eukprot:511951-Pleurochrysis_carterae.AAC.1